MPIAWETKALESWHLRGSNFSRESGTSLCQGTQERHISRQCSPNSVRFLQKLRSQCTIDCRHVWVLWSEYPAANVCFKGTNNGKIKTITLLLQNIYWEITITVTINNNIWPINYMYTVHCIIVCCLPTIRILHKPETAFTLLIWN